MENHYMYELSYNTKKNCLNWHLHKLLQLFYFHPINISLKIPLKKKHVCSDASHSNLQKQFKNVKKVDSVYWTFLINFHFTNNSKNRTHGDEEWKWSHTEWKFIPPRRTKTRSQGWCLTIGFETTKTSYNKCFH